ncbi:hypothetical protein P8631_00795 [Guyparkeria sp. 1SP6A2]|nr:hypothetical protein [Guyparkeria sp. 1SP6A2]
MVAAGVILAALVGALLHRYRGGGFDLPRPGRSLWATAPAVGLIAWPFVGALPAFYLATLYLLGSVNGWGSYFCCGRKKDGWADEPEVAWIDKALLALFGPQWATDEERIHPIHAARGDVIHNEGRTRSFEWQQRRDCTGMALRGLHYLPAFLVIPTALASWWALLPGIAALTLFAPAYRLGHMTRWGTGAAEYIVGAAFGAALAGQYLLGA